VSEWDQIEGETPIDPSGLIDPSIGTRGQLNIAEGKAIAEVVYRYLLGTPSAEDAPFDYAWSLSLHREMFGGVWRWAGKPRRHNLNLGVAWEQVEQQLYDLFLRLPYWRSMPLLEQAARLHHAAVAIHPFENGNGRWSRMLANIWMKQHGSIPTVWPEATVGAVSVVRDEYLSALRAADRMEFGPLIALHVRFTPE
jgi:Fic-DOC domain mobile mystery protein B